MYMLNFLFYIWNIYGINDNLVFACLVHAGHIRAFGL